MSIDIKLWYYEHGDIRKSFTTIYEAILSYTKEPYYIQGAPSNVRCFQYKLEFDYYDKI